MKKVFIFIVLCLVFSRATFAATIVLVADAWPPYNNVEGDADKGYIVEIAEAIFTKQGYQVEYKLMPWKVAIEETRKGTYDALIGADTDDGAGFVFPEEDVGSYQVGFFVKKGNPWRFTDTRSLERIKLGVAEGYGYNEWLNEYITANNKNFNRVQSASGDQPLGTNLRKLVDNRIDVTAATSSNMYYTAQLMGIREEIQFAGSGGPGHSIYLAFSPRKPTSQKYAQLFDQGLREMRASGELLKILERYGLSDWRE